VPQHPSPGLGHRWIGWNPAVAAYHHPLSMGGGCIWLELHHLLLLGAHQPALSAWLFRRFVGGAVTGQGGRGDGSRRQLCKALLPEQCPGVTMANSQLVRGSNRVGSLSGLNGAGEPNGTLTDELLLCSMKRSLSQSKRGLREASGGLGLRPRSNQGRSPLHGSMHRSRPWVKMSNNFLFLNEKT